MNLYLDHRGVYWVGDDQGAIPLGPSAAEFLAGVKASLEHAANANEFDSAMIVSALGFVDLVRPDAVEPPLRLIASSPRLEA